MVSEDELFNRLAYPVVDAHKIFNEDSYGFFSAIRVMIVTLYDEGYISGAEDITASGNMVYNVYKPFILKTKTASQVFTDKMEHDKLLALLAYLP